MMGFVSRKYHGQRVLELESEIVCLKKQNEGLWEKLKQGEEKLAEMAREVEAYKADNATLYMTREHDRKQLREAKNRMQEMKLQLGSIEARWGQKGAI